MDQGIRNAVQTGLKLLAAEDIATPNAWNQDLATLQSVLIALLQGQLTLEQAEQTNTGSAQGLKTVPAADPKAETG